MRHYTILISGDICPTSGNFTHFCKGDAAGIFYESLDDFTRADLTVLDLECPLANLNL